jgi:peptidoglycan-N-acetylmuramic acid deacetylase
VIRKPAPKTIAVLSIVTIIASIAVCVLVSYKSQITWLTNSILNKENEPLYLNATIAGHTLNDTQSGEIETVLEEVEEEIGAKSFTLAGEEKSWTVTTQQIGISLDKEKTREKLTEVENLGLLGKIGFALKQGNRSYTIAPELSYDLEKCKKALAGVKVPSIPAKDASFYFDGDVRIRKESNGEKLNPEITCQGIGEDIAQGATSGKIKMEILEPKIKSSQLEKILSQVKGIVEKPLSFSYGQKSWQVGPQKLTEMLEITVNKDGSLDIGWSKSKLDKLISSFAAGTNSDNPTPKLGRCQTLDWTGGYRLDKDHTRAIFDNLKSDSPNSYSLKVDHFGSSIQKITPVKKGTKGTIFLTFDDGMSYSNQIMNLAGCYGIKVAFFVIGQRASADAPTMRRAIANGHAVQTHGYEHAAYNYASGHSYSWQYNDIHKSISIITSITGVRPTYFRPPGGNHNNDTKKAAAANGVRMILWNTTSIDTVTYAPSQICSNVIYHLVPSGSVLMHSTKSATLAALPCIVRGIAGRGYSMSALR